MRYALLVVALALTPGSAFAAYMFAGAFFNSGGVAMVPDVVGGSAAAADTALEGAGLDTGVVTQQCSSEPVNEVLIQSPVAGTPVPLGTLVNLWTSNGTACRSGGQGLNIRIGIGL